MKLNFAMIAALLTSLAAAPAFADWDMPDASSLVSTASSNVANMTFQPAVKTVFSDLSAVTTSGFDLNSLSAILDNATAGDALSSQQQSKYTANTTDKTGTQEVSTLPECRTATLADVTGPLNADGLPACTLASLASMSVSSQGATAIYGDAGKNGPINMAEDFGP
jgi:hypothetical protein